MLRVCSEPGCTTLTLGSLCLEHEPVVAFRAFPRGRPYGLKDGAVLSRMTARVATAEKEPATGVVLLEGAG